MKSRDQSEQDAGGHRDQQRKREHHQVGRDPFPHRQVLGRKLHQSFDTPERDNQTERSAGNSKADALREKLADGSPPSSAERGTYCNFALPSRCARQQKVRDIRAGYEQHAANRAEQNQHRQSHIAHHVFSQRNDARTPSCVEVVVLALEIRCNACHLGRCGLYRNAGLQTSDGMEVAAAARPCRIDPHRQPQLSFRIHVAETSRHHSDHSRRIAVENQPLSQNVRACPEFPPPEFVTNDCYRGRTDFVVSRAERPADDRLNAEDAEELMCSHLNRDLFRLAGGAQTATAVGVRGDGFEHAIPRTPVDVVRCRDHVPRAVAIAVVLEHQHQPVRIVEWKAPQQQRVYYRENRGICSDSESERQNGNTRETGIAGHHSDCVSEILRHRHGCPENANAGPVGPAFIFINLTEESLSVSVRYWEHCGHPRTRSGSYSSCSRVVAGDPAVRNFDNPAAVRRVHFRMGHLDDGDPIVFVELAEQLHDLFRLRGVQIARWARRPG